MLYFEILEEVVPGNPTPREKDLRDFESIHKDWKIEDLENKEKTLEDPEWNNKKIQDYKIVLQELILKKKDQIEKILNDPLIY